MVLRKFIVRSKSASIIWITKFFLVSKKKILVVAFFHAALWSTSILCKTFHLLININTVNSIVIMLLFIIKEMGTDNVLQQYRGYNWARSIGGINIPFKCFVFDFFFLNLHDGVYHHLSYTWLREFGAYPSCHCAKVGYTPNRSPLRGRYSICISVSHVVIHNHTHKHSNPWAI